MDQVLTPDDTTIEAESNSKSDTSTTAVDSHVDFSSLEPKIRAEDESKRTSQLSSLEMDRTCIRPMKTDDIISKELPYKILDTDFDGKDEENGSPADSQLLSVATSKNSENNENEPDQRCENALEEQLKADIIEQDTGYSSDGADNVKSAKCENIVSTEIKKVEVNESSFNTDECSEHNVTDDVTNKVCEQLQPTTEQKSLHTSKDDFVPTIVGIRGAFDSTASNETTTLSNLKETSSDVPLQQINIVNVQGSCEKHVNPDHQNSEKSNEVLKVVDSSDSRNADNIHLNPSYSADLDIKQEPPETGDRDDCMYVGTQDTDTCFTSEIFIEEEKNNDNEKKEEEVICIESSGKIPSPIPIKIEANIDGEEKLETSQSQSSSKESKTNFPDAATREPNLPVVKNAATIFSAVGYSCHLCNMTFQEHELLNDHMTLHRNNLVDPKAINKMKEKLTCPICKRQLSSLQSLEHHVRIHNDEKRHVCNICGKNFRHQSNYKLHLQKHEAEKERAKLAVGRSAVASARTVNQGKLIGQVATNQGTKAYPSKTSFTMTSSLRRDNAKENVNTLHRSFTCRNRAGEIITRTRVVDDADDDVIPLKTFSNVENIVMNAARFIVKLDNLDPNVLKRRIKTPDISIDKNSIGGSRRAGEKRKIVLSSSDSSKRVKLDQIENIIMDTDTECDQPQVDATDRDDRDYDYDFGDDGADSDSDTPKGAKSASKRPETLTDKELFELLNDREDDIKDKTHDDYVSQLRKNAQMILKNEAEKSKNSYSSNSSSNVILLKCMSSSKRRPSSTIPHLDNKLTISCASETPYESYSSENSDDEMTANDSFDAAFHRVALRRLLLIQKRAAKNNGKVDSKYLLGPLFWRKALRRAKLNTIDFDVNSFPDSIASQSPTPNVVDKFGKVDDRRTNDPKRLQIRAENKLNYMLDKIRLTNNANNLNLIGPLFWKKTLQLAGIHYPRDLSTLLSKERLSLQDVEFVDEQLSITATKVMKNSPQESNLHVNSQIKETSSKNSIDCDSNNRSSVLVDSILSDVVVQPPSSRPIEANTITKSSDSSVLSRNNSILYDSLTRSRDPSLKPLNNDAVVVKSQPPEENVSDVVKQTDTSTASTVAEVVDTVEGTISDSVTNKEALGESIEVGNAADVSNANIVLNVDEGDFQLIAQDNDKLGELSEGTNYVLVSDETGTMQLVKENDLHLVEGNDVSGEAQYVVNLQGENYANLELMGQVNGEQLSYALQFDGENYAAIQFVQNDVNGDGKVSKSEEENVDVNVGNDSGESAGYILPTVTADIGSIGKELSDFLNLNYNNLTKDDKNGT